MYLNEARKLHVQNAYQRVCALSQQVGKIDPLRRVLFECSFTTNDASSSKMHLSECNNGKCKETRDQFHQRSTHSFCASRLTPVKYKPKT